MASILHIADYGSPYVGDCISSLLYPKEIVAEKLSLDMALVFSKIAEGHSWLNVVKKRNSSFGKEKVRPC